VINKFYQRLSINPSDQGKFHHILDKTSPCTKYLEAPYSDVQIMFKFYKYYYPMMYIRLKNVHYHHAAIFFQRECLEPYLTDRLYLRIYQRAILRYCAKNKAPHLKDFQNMLKRRFKAYYYLGSLHLPISYTCYKNKCIYEEYMISETPSNLGKFKKDEEFFNNNEDLELFLGFESYEEEADFWNFLISNYVSFPERSIVRMWVKTAMSQGYTGEELARSVRQIITPAGTLWTRSNMYGYTIKFIING